jgi:hypothetical protein
LMFFIRECLTGNNLPVNRNKHPTIRTHFHLSTRRYLQLQTANSS